MKVRYNSFQKKFIVYIYRYRSNIQEHLLKNILQDFLKEKNKYGIEINEKNIYILANKNNNIDEISINKYISEIYSIVYLLYELEKKELIYFSKSVIKNNFKYSVTSFENDSRDDINIKEEKCKFFLQIINSQIYISSELRTYIFFNRFFFTFDRFIFWIGVLVSIATIISTIYDVLTFHFKE